MRDYDVGLVEQARHHARGLGQQLGSEPTRLIDGHLDRAVVELDVDDIEAEVHEGGLDQLANVCLAAHRHTSCTCSRQP